MSKSPPLLLPSVARLLSELGARIRQARLRRRLTTAMVAERAAISLPTLRLIEQGSPTVSLGAYTLVLLALNLEKDLNHIADDDNLGRHLQDLNLPTRVRVRTRRAT